MIGWQLLIFRPR